MMVRRLAAPVLAVVVLLSACAEDASPAASPTPEPTGGQLERFEAGGEPAAIYLPEGEVQGVLIYHHGAGQHLDDVLAQPTGPETLVGRLLARGWAVAASEAHGDNWGSQAGIDANAALWEEIDRRLDVEQVVLLALSMGGVSSLNCIVAGCVPDVDGWIGIFPLVDQRSLKDSSVASTVLPAIEETFGGPPPESLIPMENIQALTDVPMLMWASPEDTLVPIESNAAELARKVEAAGGEAELRLAHGEHNDPSHYDVEAVLDFIAGL